MTRPILNIFAFFSLLLGSAFAVPVAVNDSYTTAEDTVLTGSGAPFLGPDTFGVDLLSWTFVNNIFPATGTSGTVSNTWTGAVGNPDGSAQITRQFSQGVNGLANTRTTGYSKGFTLTTAQTVRVTFDWRVVTSGAAAGATATAQSRLATTGTATSHGTFTGNGTSAWQTVTYTAALGAGAQTLQVGVLLTQNNVAGAAATVNFDNIKVEATGASGVLANDTGAPISAALVANVTHGSLTLNTDGSFTYTPAQDYNGPDSFTYTCSDGATTSNVGTVNITVTAVNDAPTGAGDSYAANRDTVLNVPVGTGVLVNDTDPEAAQASLTAVLNSNAVNGNVVLNANGSFTYTPAAGYTGADSFTYRASDGVLQSANTTVNITVSGMGPPAGVADAYSLIRNTSLVVVPTTTQAPVLETILPFVAPAWKYLDNGTDQGTAWRVAGFNDTAWVSGPARLGYAYTPLGTTVGFGPDASNKYVTTYFRKTINVTNLHLATSLEVTLNYDDAGIVYINGNQVLITPGLTAGAAYNTFSSANAGNNLMQTGTVTIPASGLVEGENTVAVEIHQNLGTSSDIVMDCRLMLTKTVYAGVLANDTDAELDPLTASLVTNVANGSLTLNPNGTFTYTPTAGYSGPDSFVYRAHDGTAFSANTTVTLAVIAGANQPPIVAADSYNATEETLLTVPVGTGVLFNDSDGEGDTFTAELVTGITPSAAGSLTLNPNGSFSFTPALNYMGAATFIYRARDAQNAVSGNATVTINVANVNDAPVAAVDSYATDVGVTLNVSTPGVLGNDSDPDGTTPTAALVTGISPGAAGSLTLNVDGSFSFVPAVGFSGVATFVYRATDGALNSANTTVSISINGRPIANDDTYAATEDVPLSISAPGVLSDDTDPDMDPLTAILVTQPNAAHGTVVLNANGSFIFTPMPNFNGATSFTYKVNDGIRDSVLNATVTINVAPANDAPTGVADTYGTPVSTPLTVLAAGGVLANDTDPENNALTIAAFTQPTNGTLIMNVDGSFTYTPTVGYAGADAFTYRATDATLQSGITMVSLKVGVDPSAIVINEIMYHPPSNVDLHEYIELYNRGAIPVNLTNWKLTAGANFTFPNVTLPAGGFLIVASDVAAFNATYGGVPLIVGGWVGSLANGGETIRLQYPDSNAADGYSEADQVDYSKEGDWGLRRAFASGGETGWEWQARADGLGDSIELINPLISNNNGQNWTKREIAAVGNQRTPGGVNTDLNANPTLNSSPLISDVKHRPAIPLPGQTVNVTAKFSDELTTGITATVFYRTWVANQNVATTPAGNFQPITMLDDGLHGDGLANDGEFGATLPSQNLGIIVEFYVRGTDSGARNRTWPAPTNTAGTVQGANCVYQVDDEVWTARQPIYRLIATGSDQYEYDPARWTSASDSAINVTFISRQGDDTDVHYQSSVRVRGAGSRGNAVKNWKIDWPADNQFNGQRGGNLNVAYPYIQYLGAQLMKQANLPHEGAIPVQVRLNRTNHSTNTTMFGFGSYVHMQPIGEDTYVDDNFSTDPNGNVYKKVRPHQAYTVSSDAGGAPNIAGYLAQGWSKQSNTSVNNWSDLHAWMQVITSSYNETTLGAVMDIDQWCRALAMTTIIYDNETNISNGANDDYGFYFGVTDPRCKLLIHDYDTILAGGDASTTATGSGIYHMIDPAVSDAGVLTAMTNFYSDPQINQRYKAQLFDLLNTVFLPVNFDATVDAQLTDWVTPDSATFATLRASYKTYNAARRTHILGIINGTFSATCSLAVTGGYPTTTTATSTGLSGTVNSVTTRRITVNGIPVTINNYNGGASGSGTWSAGTAITLLPGINQLVVRALGKDDVVLNTQTFNIVYDDASVTNVSTSIATNTAWTAANGPYRITAGISVNATLSIQPGTTVYIDPGMSVTVSNTGRILAEGTADLPVRISRETTTAGTWDGIVLDESPQESRFVNVIFDGNGTTAITTQAGSRLYVDRVTFLNAAAPFLSLADSSYSIHNTTFPDSTAAFAPIYANGNMAGGEAVIRSCVFGKTLGNFASLTCLNLKRPNTILQLLNNTFNGSQADLVQLNGCDAWVEGNTFLHAHRNSAAVKSSAIAGGQSGALKSNVTIIRNLIYDCDHAITMREGNAFAALQNTIARITHTGGTDTASGVFNFANAAEANGYGGIAEANIIWDATALTRTYNSGTTLLNLDNNILPLAWAGSGTDNVVTDPLLNLASITTPATATAAQVAAAFTPEANSPAIARGTLGVVDRGALIPTGVLVAGAPVTPTPNTNALLMFGPNGGFGTFPIYGYTHYKAAVDNGAYGAETSVSTALSLTGLSVGVHTVSILGKNDAGTWQAVPSAVTWTVDPAAITVQINEVLADNLTAYPVGATRPDFVELYNYGSVAVNLANMSVSDNPTLPRKYVFPAGTAIPAGGYLVLLANAVDANPGIHIGFGFDADGDTFALYPQNAVIGTMPVDSVTFGAQITDFSIGRTGVARTWALTLPTPLAANVAEALGGNIALKINEWCGSNDFIIGSDFLELYNPGTRAVALGGMLLSADLQVAAEHTIAPLSYIAAGGFVRYIADSAVDAGPHHLSWSISKLRESMRLLNGSGTIIDQVVSGPQRADVSEGRTNDGSVALSFFTLPTPGFSNNTILTTQQSILDNLRITELMYNPSGGSSAPEFIELKNISTTLTINIGGVKFSSGIDYTFPTNTLLTPGQFIVITSHPTNFNTVYGFPAFNTTAYVGKLADGGERVRLEIGDFQLGIHDFAFSSTWHPANANGASIEIINPLAARTTWELAESWRATAANPGIQGVFGVVSGNDQSVSLPATTALAGVISYGTQIPANVTLAWTRDSGPGTVTFSAPTALTTTATFPLPGTYVLRLTATGTATVFDTLIVNVDEDYNNWATRAIGSNTAINGLLHDADGDGHKNILEYAFGTNPTSGTPALLTSFSSGGLFAVSFTRSSTANVTFAIEVADTISGPWTSDTIVTSLQTDNGILQTWIGYDTRPISANTQRFIRARVVAN